MKRGNGLLIVLGAAALTFATLQFTLGSEYRNQHRYGHRWHQHCDQNDHNVKPEDIAPEKKL